MYRLIGIGVLEEIGIRLVKNVRNFRSNYFTAALIMKLMVISIQLNSQIN